MTFSFRPIDEIQAKDWDRLVQGSPDGWVFALQGWQRLVTEVEPWGFVEHGFGVYQGECLLAVVPLHVQAASRVAGSSGWGGAGPVIEGGLDAGLRRQVFAAAAARMIEVAEGARATRLDVSCSPVTASSIGNRWAIDPLALLGFEDRSLMSQVIALDVDEKALWSGLSKTARNLVRRSERAGFRVEQVDWPDALEAYYDIHRETYARTGVSPHPKRYFQGIAEAIAPLGAARLLALISPGGEPVAFQGMAALGRGTNYHIGCSRDAVQSISPGYALMWAAIQAAKAEGRAWFDVGWIFPSSEDPKQRGLTHFKTRFGGEAHRAFRAERKLAVRATLPEPVAKARPETVGFRHRTLAIARRFLATGTEA